jgi:predicted RNase H-like HicB family nuclease
MAKFKILLYDGEDGYFVTECPELPGCVSQGKTKAEALKNMKEAMELYLECVREHNTPLRKVDFLDISIQA